MPNTFTEKSLREPLRVGLLLGALTVPTLWIVSEDILRLATHYRILDAEAVTSYFAAGALPGMFLGAGAVRAWAAWHDEKRHSARWLLISHGALVTVAILGWLLPQLWNSAHSGPSFLLELPVFSELTLLFDVRFWKNFPLQLALAMLLFGLFLRGKNA